MLRLVRQGEPDWRDIAREMPTAPLTRSRGEARLSFKGRAEHTALDTLYQSGCLRVRLPRPENAGSLDAVVINTGGGLTGGDEISLAARWRAGTAATLCSQAAEKIYRSSGLPARVATRLIVDVGAAAEWLPQETILFNRASLDRRLEVHLEPGASFLGLEAIVFGRTAMGEEVVAGSLRDTWRIHRGHALIYADIFQLDGNMAARLDRKAVGAGARAVAQLLLVTESLTQDVLDTLRSALALAKGRAAASLWNGILAVRFLAREGETLRHDIALALRVLRGGRPLLRVWQC